MKINNLTADKLRKSILQLAIQGKLVKQNPDDEPASELVKKIYAEKQKLIAEGKIKKDKTESYIYKGDDNRYYEKIGKNEPVDITDDLPFDIPDSWEWIRIDSVFNIINGFTPLRSNEKFWKDGTISWFTVEDIHKQGKYIENTKVKINSCACSQDRISPKNSFLLCCTASIGEFALTKIPLTTNQQFNALSLKDYSQNIYNMEFILAIGVYFKNVLMSIAGTTTFPFVSTKKLGRTLLPLPPLEEQQRIVEKIESMEPYLAQYDKIEKQLTKLESEIKDKLKKSILQYAIQGKLVKQNPNDEPASILLERIKAEKEQLIKEGKIKRDKNESFIYKGDDKNYYENLPSNWIITNFSNVISLTSGTDLESSEYSIKNIGVPYLTGASNINDNLDIVVNRYTNFKYVNSHKDEILLTCKGTVGKVVQNTIGDVHVARQFMSIKSFINLDYTKIYLETLVSSLNSEAKSIIPGIDRKQVLSKIILLPPIKEQIKIVERVNLLIKIIF